MSEAHSLSPKGRAKLSLLATIRNMNRKGIPCSETRRKNISIARMGHPVSEETRKKISDAQRGEKNQWYGTHGPNYGKPSPMLGKKHSEETKQIIREKRKLQITSKQTREKMSKSRIGDKNPNWIGGATEYCHKFHNGTLRHRVRAFFDNKCVLCGEPAKENETLHVHHVYYNKKACCEILSDGKYYSDLGFKFQPKNFEIIGDPNKFVPPHNSCHTKTTLKRNRTYYARLFEKIINEQHNGKSYFTEAEYSELGKTKYL